MGRMTTRRPVRFLGRQLGRRSDTLAVEEPLEVRHGGDVLTVTMRTPGHDVELVHGWLHAEGHIGSREDVGQVRYCAGSLNETGTNTYNVVEVDLRHGAVVPARSTTLTTSACGVCGAASIEALSKRGRFDVAADPVLVRQEVLTSLPDRLREEQRVFDSTGGLHAAGLFTAEGEALVVREDVGRHNAVDKVLGWALMQDLLPLRGTVLQVSGRASFELAQKAWLAGVPVLSAVSAPSSLAVDLAQEAGMTMAGFVRGGRANLYTRPERVVG